MLLMALLGGFATAAEARLHAEKPKGLQKPTTDIELALSAATEVEALNSGVLSAERGVFNPKVALPGQDSKPGPSLSNKSQ